MIQLEFLEQYIWADFTADSNLVEISIDGGDSWQTIFTSDPSILDNWTSRLIDLSSFEGESILLSFRYIDFSGNAEGWRIDQVVIKELFEPEELLSSRNESTSWEKN